jgi:hypothetical protein
MSQRTVRKLHDPCRTLADVLAEMRARLDIAGAGEERQLRRWIAVIDAEIAQRQRAA